MPIVESAPKGWEFQYAATAMIGLRHLNDDGTALLVEPNTGEDAELVLETKCGRLIIEIQAKSSQSDLDASVLATFLAHFPNGLATDNLLARLLKDKDRVALFIVGARCGDSTRDFLARVGEVEPKSKSTVTRARLNDLIAEFEKAYRSKNSSKLESDRNLFCRKLAADLRADQTAAMQVAQRVIVWEQLEEVALEQNIENALWYKHSVPRTQARNARLASVEAVRLARDEHADVIPKLKSALAQFVGMMLLPEPYLERGCEVALLEELRRRRVLFLTGQSKCGKSLTARFLAEECRKAGISCAIGDRVPEAVRYLNAVGQDDRLFLLDDPFGHLTLDATAADDLSRLRNLLDALPPHRFLIVTSRIDIVSAAEAKVPTPSFGWYDLTVKDSAFLVDFWASRCLGKGLSVSAFNTVQQNLTAMNQNDLLQPGQLRYLAFITDPVPETDFAELCSLARCNSVDLANSFLSKGGAIQQLHAALALGATVIHALPIQCLNYLLSADSSRPGIHPKGALEMVRLGYDGPPPQFPADPNVAEISAVQRDELSLLEQRGFIRFSRNQLTFAHPDYFEASASVLLRIPAIRFGELLGIATRAVTGLYSAIARNAIRQLPRMHDNYTDREQRRDIVELAFLAVNSIFPSVRDLALTTLILWLDELNKSDQERVLDLIRRTALRFDDILWHDGVPWLNPKPRLFGENPMPSEQVNYANFVKRLLDPTRKNPLSVREAWALVSTLKDKSKDEVPYPALKVLMRFEEGFIRADAAFLLCANLPNYDEEAVRLALDDDHPAVAFEGVIGCFATWETFAPNLRSKLLKDIQRVFEKIAVVVYANRFVIDFGDSEDMGSIRWGDAYRRKTAEKWLLWANIAPVFLRTASKHTVWITESNLWNTTRRAREYLSPEIGLVLCQAWLEWIEAQLKRTLPDDYGLALAEFLVEVTAEAPSLRSTFSAHLLNHSDTAFLLSSVREFISHWSELTDSERSMLLALFTSDRHDRRWIRALALTRSNSPSDVVERITGAKSLYRLSAQDAIGLLSDELLQDCLHVYTGEHPILDSLGFSRSADEPWHQVLEYSVERPKSPHFELGLREMLSSSLNGQNNWPNAYRIWAKLCNGADEDLRERLFHSLLTWTIRINGNASAIFWRVFFNKVKAPDKPDNYLGRIMNVIEAVDKTTQELDDTFGRERFYARMLPKLASDKCVLEVLAFSKRFNDPTVRMGFFDLIDAFYQKYPPRLHRVHQLVADYVGQDNAQLRARVEEVRQQGLETGSAQSKQFNDVYPALPPGWNSWREDDRSE